MKKILAVLCAAVFALSLSVVASADNITGNGKVISSTPADNQPASSAVDGNMATYWGAKDFVDAWIGMEYDAPAAIESIVMNWGGGHPIPYAEGGFIVETSQDGSTWTKVDVTVERKDIDDTHYDDTITLKDVAAKAVRVKITAANGTKDSAQVWEMTVNGSLNAVVEDPAEDPAEGDETPDEGEDPVESTEDPAEGDETPDEGDETPDEGEAPVESTENPVESTQAPAESTADDADAGSDSASPVLWIVLACVAAAVIVAVVVVVIKKIKK